MDKTAPTSFSRSVSLSGYSWLPYSATYISSQGLIENMARGGKVVYKRGSGRKRRFRSKDDDDEDDGDSDAEYVAEEEDVPESSCDSLASSRDGSEEENFDFSETTSNTSFEEAEEEDDDDDDEEIEVKKSKSRSRQRSRVSVPRRKAVDDVDLVISVPVKKARSKPRSRKSVVSDDEEQVASVPRRKARATPRSQKSRVSDYEEDDDGDDAGDEDFAPDEDEDDEEENDSRMKGALQRCGNKRKPKVLKKRNQKKKTMVRKRRRRRAPSSDEDDFIVKDRVAVEKRREKSKKVTPTRKRRRREVTSSDDDDFVVKVWTAADTNRKKRQKKVSKMKKRRSTMDSDSSDFDYEISEEEVRDLRIGGTLKQQQPEKIFAGRKVEEKGKEKEGDVKQMCGICLSEEQKGIVQGTLNCCSHYFCFACIMEWSKIESRCPVCKRRFVAISKSTRSVPGFGLRKAVVIRVAKRDQVYQPSEEEMRGFVDPYENVVCMECHRGGDDNLMLLCDICDSSAHTYCAGLGREVPEGNWYCEGCRSIDNGSSSSQIQDNTTDQGPSSGDLFSRQFSAGTETEVVANNIPTSTISRQSASLSGQSSSQRIDLNVSPRYPSGEDFGAASPASGAGASTLSWRRAIQQHIRILLSNNRVREVSARSTVPHHNLESDVITSEVEQEEETMHTVSGHEPRQQNSRPVIRSNANTSSCMFSEGSGSRLVEGAKEQVQSMVRSHLKNLSRDTALERATFKEIARHSTHTILAACGIEHRRSMVTAPVQPPNNCSHEVHGGPTNLLRGCCSSCFNSFVREIEPCTFKEIARHCTHTILAACGIEHRRSMVAAPVQPPNNCSHEVDGGTDKSDERMLAARLTSTPS